MKIVYVANHHNSAHSDDTEGHISKALEELGHEVIKAPQSRKIVETGDMLLFHKWIPVNFDGIKVCWYFDKIWKDRHAWFDNVHPQVDYLFMTDGTFGRGKDKVTILRQGIGDPTPGKKLPISAKIAFAGSLYDERVAWGRRLKARYGDDFQVFHDVFNRDLNDLCASVPIFVAPEYPSDDDYWSNRVYVITGSGGFLLHPRLKGLEEEWGDNLVYYDNEQDMFAKIDYYLHNPEEREKARKKAHDFCVKNFTFKERCKTLLKTIGKSE